MNLETLKYFKYTAKYKNITRAAKHFYISQSTLSRHIIALEEELGAKLFERDNRKLELTSAGRVFDHDCDLFIKHMETLISNVQNASLGNAGVLRVTSPGRLFATLPEALKQVKEKFPSADLIVESYDFNEIPSAVHHDIYNVGFTYNFAVQDFDDLVSIPIGSDGFSLAVSSSLYENPTIDSIPDIVKSLPLMLPTYAEPPFLKLMLHELQEIAGQKKVRITYVNTTDSVMLDASLGLGFGIVPTALTKSKSGNKNISYYDLNELSAKATIVMLHKKDISSPLISTFIDIIKELCKNSDC